RPRLRRAGHPDTTRGDAMDTGHEPSSPGQSFTAADVELAESRAKEARERAARAGLAAAKSFEESARCHKEVARVQEGNVEHGVPLTEVHQEAVIRHREAAERDHAMAEQKWMESEADLSGDYGE